MARNWSFVPDSYNVRSSNLSASAYLPFCQSLDALLESSRKGRRMLSPLDPQNHVFYPHECAFRWLNSESICNILSQFSSISWYGDSIMRHTIQVATMLAANDLIVGGIPKGSSNILFQNCRCDGQLSEAMACRDTSTSIFVMANSRRYGICRTHQRFEMSLVDNQGATVNENSISSCIDRTCPTATEGRPRVVIINFGLHLEPKLNGTVGQEYLSSLLRGYTHEANACARQGFPFDVYFIVFSTEPFDHSVSQKYPGQDDDNVYDFNDSIKEFIEELSTHLRSRVVYLNSTAIIRGGQYVDGCHPLTESVAIRVQYLLNIMGFLIDGRQPGVGPSCS